MKTRYWDVVDPMGFEHSVVIAGTEPFGYTNIAHHISIANGPGPRAALINQVLTALYAGRQLPQGYTAKEVFR